MFKLLIADASLPFTDALQEVLKNEFEVKTCQDGETALAMLAEFQPDVLVLNLMLPFKDGLTVLQETSNKPNVILAISTFVSAYIEQAAIGVGVQYIMLTPTVNALRVRLMDMVATTITPKEDLLHQTAVHLHILNLFTHLDGYQQLCVGIPIYAEKPDMRLSKELYPAIAQRFHLPDARTVEHSIRKAISAAWARRNPLVWEKYFPSLSDCPTNKTFICRLAELLDR